jgi:hypothetical protein
MSAIARPPIQRFFAVLPRRFQNSPGISISVGPGEFDGTARSKLNVGHHSGAGDRLTWFSEARFAGHQNRDGRGNHRALLVLKVGWMPSMNPPGWTGVERIPGSRCHLTAGGAVRQRMVSIGSKPVIGQIHLSTCLGRAKSFTEIGTASRAASLDSNPS